jgi:hypothetical protein
MDLVILQILGLEIQSALAALLTTSVGSELALPTELKHPRTVNAQNLSSLVGVVISRFGHVSHLLSVFSYQQAKQA